MISRERVELALAHQEPDRVPLDLGATCVTGMQASSVYQLRQALRLDEHGTPVQVVNTFMMLGEIKLDAVPALCSTISKTEDSTTSGRRTEN